MARTRWASAAATSNRVRKTAATTGAAWLSTSTPGRFGCQVTQPMVFPTGSLIGMAA